MFWEFACVHASLFTCCSAHNRSLQPAILRWKTLFDSVECLNIHGARACREFGDRADPRWFSPIPCHDVFLHKHRHTLFDLSDLSLYLINLLGGIGLVLSFPVRPITTEMRTRDPARILSQRSSIQPHEVDAPVTILTSKYRWAIAIKHTLQYKTETTECVSWLYSYGGTPYTEPFLWKYMCTYDGPDSFSHSSWFPSYEYRSNEDSRFVHSLVTQGVSTSYDKRRGQTSPRSITLRSASAGHATTL